MEGIKALLKNERGVVLVISLMILTLLVGAGIGAIVSTQTDLKTSGNLKTATQAFYIAEAGLQRALRQLNKVTNWVGGLSNTSDAFSGDNSLGGGTYVVQVFNDDPSPPNVRIISIGNIGSSSSTVEAVVAPEFFPILDYALFSCGNITLKEGIGGVDSLVSGGDVFASGNLDLEATGTHQIQNGNVSVLGDININGTSSITGGNASANGNIDVSSSASTNIGGNATAGGNITGSGTISGTSTQSASPDPVTNLCQGSELASRAITSDIIQGFRDSAGTTISGDLEVTSGTTITQTGIVHVTGNFELSGTATLSGNVIYIIDGNAEIAGPGSLRSSPPGSSVTFLVPTGNFDVKENGDFTIDGAVQVGTVNTDGTGISGGNITVETNSNLTINGSAIAVNGNTDNQDNSALTVNYQPPTDSNLTKSSGFTLKRWNDVVG